MSALNYKQQAIAELANSIKQHGFRVFIADNGTYGFFTDQEGTRVVSFQFDLRAAFCGKYKSKKCGAGWRLDDGLSFQAMIEQNPPEWATKGESVEMTTLTQHLETYASSRYTEI